MADGDGGGSVWGEGNYGGGARVWENGGKVAEIGAKPGEPTGSWLLSRRAGKNGV